MSDSRSPSTYRILAVCTGNICRSPMVERLLRAGIDARLGPKAAARFEIRSAGTWAQPGAPMEPYAVDCLVGLGADASGFAARDLTPELVTEADLVLAATREHRAAAVTLVPRATSYTLTVRELARLLGPVTPEELPRGDAVRRMRAIVTAAVGNRGLVPPQRPSDDDVADPYRQPLGAFVRAAHEIEAALRVPLRLLAPPDQR